MRRLPLVLAVLTLCVCGLALRSFVRRPVVAVLQEMKGKKTVADRVNQFGEAVHARLTPDFERIGVAYPPRQVTLIGLKSERMLQVWVAGADGAWRPLKDYPILGLSGSLGPKLREGDRQVPEGVYRVESLNPNSLYHLALRVNYPNADDRQRGEEDGRTALGSDIMIHGKDCSVGCLAMGDRAAEDLFVLAADTGIGNITILLSPVDFRVRNLPKGMPPVPAWMRQRYDAIRNELDRMKTGREQTPVSPILPP